jgi:hypothetical protein
MPTAHIDNGNATKSLVSMRDYVDLLDKERQDDLDAQKELLCVKIESLQLATTLAKENLELRLVGMNEWRQQSRDREDNFVGKTSHADLMKRVNDLELTRATLEGKASQTSVNIAYLLAVVGWVVALLLKFVK